MNLNVIGPRLRTFRELNRWSQQLLSAKLRATGHPITRCMIANWEVQRSIVPDTFVFALATLFHVRVCDLFPLPKGQRRHANRVLQKK